MDIDIDVVPSFKPEKLFPTWPRAAIIREEQLAPHPCGVYPQAMARDPLTNLAAIPFDEAEEMGYLKVDFLHLNVYRLFESRQEIETLLKKDPDWKILQLASAQPKIFQLGKHGELLNDLKPKSILDLSDVMALIRPAKRHLLPIYKKDKALARKSLWAKDPDGGYAFKKSHAIGYSYVVWLQLHLIEQDRL